MMKLTRRNDPWQLGRLLDYIIARLDGALNCRVIFASVGQHSVFSRSSQPMKTSNQGKSCREDGRRTLAHTDQSPSAISL